MAPGRVHATVAFTYGLSVSLYALAEPTLYHLGYIDVRVLLHLNLSAVILGSIGQLIVTPDIDVNSITFEERRIIRWFGKTIGLFWRIYWYPFSLTAHRGIQHAPFISTVLRLVWLTWPCYFILGSISWSLIAQTYLIWSIGDLLHLLFDTKMLRPFVKKVKKRPSNKHSLES